MVTAYPKIDVPHPCGASTHAPYTSPDGRVYCTLNHGHGGSHSFQRTEGFKYTGQPAAVPRCEICDWPLAASIEEGCVPGNCSYRPREGSDEHRRIVERRREADARARVAKLRPMARRMLLVAHAGDLAAKASSYRDLAMRVEISDRERELLGAIADEHDALASDVLARLAAEAAPAPEARPLVTLDPTPRDEPPCSACGTRIGHEPRCATRLGSRP